MLDRRSTNAGDGMYLEVLEEMGMRVATNCADNAGLEMLSNADLARRIAACDIIVPY